MGTIEEIENNTGRRVAITFDEHDATGKFHEQQQSPLFSLLPPEIRDHIWSYCTAPFEDQSRSFAETEYYYRPGHTARLKTDVNLLYTCRRIFLEANASPMLQAEHSFYYYRAAPDARDHNWLVSLTDHNRTNFGHLHLFVQMFAIEGLTAQPGRLRRYFLQRAPHSCEFQPRMLHVTLRHTDWWFWENEEPLRLKDSWVQAMLDSPDLRSTETFKLELETLDYKVDQLRPILKRLRNLESKEYETHLVDGSPQRTRFVLSETEVEQKWHGPTSIAQGNYVPYIDKNRLNYYSVTLTWKLRFVDIPRAFVPELRRSPRFVPPRKEHMPSAHFLLSSEDELYEPESEMWFDHHWSQPRPQYRPPYHLPYADESQHGHALRMVMKRRRTRQLQAIQSGLPEPPPADLDLTMMSLRNRAIQYVSDKQSGDVEQWRRKAFGFMFGPYCERRWLQQGV